MYNKQTNAQLTDSLLFCSIFIDADGFKVNASSSGSFYSFPARLHKRINP
jgi:hypothetical protein